MSELRRWLDGRAPAMPDELRRVIDGALATSVPAPGAVADRLAAAGLDALARAVAAAAEGLEPKRRAAVHLLAADALLTYACEAAAEDGPEALERLTASLDYQRFAAVLEPAGS